ncbi:ParA family protein [Isachenkonia alkalipeptolytica]|uniref:Uncharacterized protein n=1 Tax=Isachenkonia alkalipeptolytica TaxID=2565777 RepID=A0AA44BF09_9CLOT|nr:hypothetical protein [Isachenkonia alkalipeptolytica]NBG89518.1 hypothetical protein [Isachenkonia alkalipeptolytica]
MKNKFKLFLEKYNINIPSKHPFYTTYYDWWKDRVKEPSAGNLKQFIDEFGYQFNYNTHELLECFSSGIDRKPIKTIHLISHDIPRLAFFIVTNLLEECFKEKKILIINVSPYGDFYKHFEKTPVNATTLKFSNIEQLTTSETLEPLIAQTKLPGVHYLPYDPDDSSIHLFPEDEMKKSKILSFQLDRLTQYDFILIANSLAESISTRVLSNASDIVLNYSLYDFSDCEKYSQDPYLKMKINPMVNSSYKTIRIPESFRYEWYCFNHDDELLKEITEAVSSETADSLFKPNDSSFVT